VVSTCDLNHDVDGFFLWVLICGLRMTKSVNLTGWTPQNRK
jgi:hypothetical protein